MSLYGRSDTAGNTTKVTNTIGNGPGSATATRVFVDPVEALLAENKSRGITGPGWWNYRTFVDAAGNTRHKAEHLAFISAGATGVDQADDTIVADVASAVTITVQPAASTSSSGAGTFTLTTTTTGTPGTLTFKWQRQTAAGTTWKDITASLDAGITYADFTTNTLAYSGLASTARNGSKYRVKVTSSGGTEEIISNGAATITFGT
jgi:hypothetical protein